MRSGQERLLKSVQDWEIIQYIGAKNLMVSKVVTRAKLLMRIMAMTAVSKYLFSISRKVLIRRFPQPCQNGESGSPTRQGNLR